MSRSRSPGIARGMGRTQMKAVKAWAVVRQDAAHGNCSCRQKCLVAVRFDAVPAHIFSADNLEIFGFQANLPITFLNHSSSATRVTEVTLEVYERHFWGKRRILRLESPNLKIRYRDVNLGSQQSVEIPPMSDSVSLNVQASNAWFKKPPRPLHYSANLLIAILGQAITSIPIQVKLRPL